MPRPVAVGHGQICPQPAAGTPDNLPRRAAGGSLFRKLPFPPDRVRERCHDLHVISGHPELEHRDALPQLGEPGHRPSMPYLSDIGGAAGQDYQRHRGAGQRACSAARHASVIGHELNPAVPVGGRVVVTHAFEHLKARSGNAFGSPPPAADVDQAISVTVHHQGRQPH